MCNYSEGHVQLFDQDVDVTKNWAVHLDNPIQGSQGSNAVCAFGTITLQAVKMEVLPKPKPIGKYVIA